jgi:small subunit ribosomal protein S5
MEEKEKQKMEEKEMTAEEVPTESVQTSTDVAPQLTAEEAAKKMEEIAQEAEDKKIAKEKKEAIEKLEKSEKVMSREKKDSMERLERWTPKTQLGKEVAAGKIKNIDEILKAGRKIMEPEISDSLLNLEIELLNIGQAKGKFGGGKRRAWRQTQKKTEEGNVLTFGVMAVVGDGNGYVGIGTGRASETLPAKEKAIRKAKLNIHRIRRGCASYDCSCDEEHSIPISVQGKCSSVSVKLMPAPQGTGLVAGDELKKILKLAGIKDVYSKTFGKSRTTINTAKACMEALDKLNEAEL